jgi:hypothetical protein
MMVPQDSFTVALFESVSHALRAEKLIKAAGIACKLIPVPRHLSSDCGVCLRFRTDDAEAVQSLLSGKLHFFEFHAL